LETFKREASHFIFKKKKIIYFFIQQQA